MVKPGPKDKDLTEPKKWILEKIEEEGEVSWKSLWDKERFKSPRHLSRCLKDLVEERAIEKVKVSHKDQRYRKAGSYNRLRSLIAWDKQVENMHPEVLAELREMKTSLASPMQRTAFVSALILAELRNFLFGLERVVRAPAQLYINWSLSVLRKSVLRFGDRLVTCGQTCPDETDRAIQIVQWVLHHRFGEIAEIMQPHVSQLKPLPDLNLQQARSDYENLLKTLKNKE